MAHSLAKQCINQNHALQGRHACMLTSSKMSWPFVEIMVCMSGHRISSRARNTSAREDTDSSSVLRARMQPKAAMPAARYGGGGVMSGALLDGYTDGEDSSSRHVCKMYVCSWTCSPVRPAGKLKHVLIVPNRHHRALSYASPSATDWVTGHARIRADAQSVSLRQS